MTIDENLLLFHLPMKCCCLLLWQVPFGNVLTLVLPNHMAAQG